MTGRAVVFLACLVLTACTNRQCVEAPEQISGVTLFRINCAGCHGTNARGNGPIAEFINAPVPDLTRISARNHGEFPTDRIFQVIDGQSGSSVHGVRHMPVYEFFGPEPDDAEAHLNATQKVDRLVMYLRTLQVEK